MKNRGKIFATALAAISAITMCGTLAACESELQANGPEYNYRVIPSTEDYEFTGNITSTVVPDAEIKIDGKFDESFYDSLNWYSGKKVYGNETGTLEMTTYLAKTGIVVAAKIKDSRRAYHSNTVATGNITCFNGYFAFGDAVQQSDGVYEVECTAGNRFKISQFTSSGLKVLNTDIDKTPVTAVVRDGDILSGTCYNYDVEYFMPYSMFGRESRPDKVYFNPTMISSTLKEDGSADNAVRTWYNFGYQQTPEVSKWGNPDQGYVFDRNGFVSNKIKISENGGKVEQEWGYDWCLTGDIVKFNLMPESGKSVVSVTVNGKDEIQSVKNGVLSVYCTGDIELDVVFGDRVAPLCNSTVSIVNKDGTALDLGDKQLKLTLTDRDDSSQTYTVDLVKGTNGKYTFSGKFFPGHYNLTLSENGYICTSAGYDEENVATTQLWIDEEGGTLWSVTFTQINEVSAIATLTANPTDNVDIAANVTDDGKTYEVLAYERYGGATGTDVGTENKAIATVDADNLLDGTNWKNTAYSSSGSFGNKGYDVTGGDGIIEKSCFYLDNGTVSLKLTNKVAQIRLYIGAWSGQEGKFTLKTTTGKELVSYTYSNADGNNDILVISVDTSSLEDGETLDCSLVFERLNTGHMPCAGLQLLGEKQS